METPFYLHPIIISHVALINQFFMNFVLVILIFVQISYTNLNKETAKEPKK